MDMGVFDLYAHEILRLFDYLRAKLLINMLQALRNGSGFAQGEEAS